jgi:hypothetical protein
MGKSFKDILPASSQISQFYQAEDVIGIGLVHRTYELFVTYKGSEIFNMKLPFDLRGKRLHPSVTIGSREDSLLMNFTGGTF